MKIFYVASNPTEESTLLLLQEITLLQTRLSASSNSGVRFIFLPHLPYEQLLHEVYRERPDILHISAHGSEEGVTLSGLDEKGRTVRPKALSKFISSTHPPRLVILNACNSIRVAKSLRAAVPMSIGINAEMSNRSGRDSIRVFYESLLQGQSVFSAFSVCDSMIRTIDNESASAGLFFAKNVDPKKEFFLASPRIVAKVRSNDYQADKRGEFEFRLGVIGCPGTIHQVMFFTDDELFFDDDKLSRFCSVTKGTATDNSFWTEDTWCTKRDFRIFAAGVAADGEYFMAASLLTESLLYFASRRHSLGKANKRLLDLVENLR
jgi:hypothetical protein